MIVLRLVPSRLILPRKAALDLLAPRLLTSFDTGKLGVSVIGVP